MIVDNTAFNWVLSHVDGGTKPHIGLLQGNPVIAYMIGPEIKSQLL